MAVITQDWQAEVIWELHASEQKYLANTFVIKNVIMYYENYAIKIHTRDQPRF